MGRSRCDRCGKVYKFQRRCHWCGVLFVALNGNKYLCNRCDKVGR